MIKYTVSIKPLTREGEPEFVPVSEQTAKSVERAVTGKTGTYVGNSYYPWTRLGEVRREASEQPRLERGECARCHGEGWTLAPDPDDYRRILARACRCRPDTVQEVDRYRHYLGKQTWWRGY